jgi:hypothetical protein
MLEMTCGVPHPDIGRAAAVKLLDSAAVFEIGALKREVL